MSKLYMLVGLPGSSKSTWAAAHKDELNAVIHSSDDIRAELLGDESDQSKNEEVFKILHSRVKDDLRAGKNVIYDATNLSRKKRVTFLKELKHIPCEKVCMLFATPWELCLARNFARDRQVPEEAMVRMYKNFCTPTKYEGFDDVKIIWADYDEMLGFEFDICVDMERWKQISQNNPHHSLSIGNHMIAACDYAKDKTDDIRVITAALLHDIGKESTKSYHNSHGEPSETAHFYQHHCVGSYLALFYLRNMHPEWSDEDILYVSLLINLHMRHHLAYKQSEKAKEKDRMLFGNGVMQHLEVIYECDRAAH